MIEFFTYYWEAIHTPEFQIEILKAVITAVLSFGIAFFIFWKSNRKVKIVEIQRLESIRDLLFVTLKYLYKSSKGQNDFFKENIALNQKYVNREGINVSMLTLKIYSSISAYQIEKIEHLDLFKILVSNHKNDNSETKEKRIRNYQTLISNIPILNEISLRITDIQRDSSSEIEKLSNCIFEKFEELKSHIRNIHKKKADNEFYNLLIEKIVFFHKENEYDRVDISVIVEFIEELFISCVKENSNKEKYSGIHSDFEIIFEIQSYVTGAFNKIVSSLEIVNINLRHYITNLESVEQNILEIIELEYKDRDLQDFFNNKIIP